MEAEIWEGALGVVDAQDGRVDAGGTHRERGGFTRLIPLLADKRQ
jgi:hypothetical protein